MSLLHAPEHTAPSRLFGRKPTQVELISEPRPPHRTDIHRVRRMVQGVAAGLKGLVRRPRVRSGGHLVRVGFHQPEKHARAIELGILAELKTPNDAVGKRAAVQDLALRFAVTIHIHGADLEDFLEVQDVRLLRVDLHDCLGLVHGLLLQRANSPCEKPLSKEDKTAHRRLMITRQ
jgi:hypothetical protein